MSKPGCRGAGDEDRRALRVLFDEVAARCSEVRSQVDALPCRAGCDHCCRHLSREPQLTRAEWELLQEALERIPPGHARLARLRDFADTAPAKGPVTCPLLEAESGLCSVYEVRPLACRSYGYYRSHSHDAWCSIVEAHLGASAEEVVWGNEAALERRLERSLGPARGLSRWLQEWFRKRG